VTSSLNLQPLADYQGALLAAVTEVAENSLFAFADASDEAAFDATAAASETDGDWLCARMAFTGPISGQFALTLPAALARRLCAAFAGADSTDDIGDADLVDFTGELANMVCGTWLTRTCRQVAFDLTPPRVLRGGPGRATAGNAGHVESARVYLAIEDTPVRLEIAWGAMAPTVPPSDPERADAR
jgi:CheY-specific phosphatase CheX